MLLVGLDLARRVVGMELPAEVMRALDEDSEAIRLSHEAMERLARDSSELRGTERTLTQIRYRERFLDRARLFCYLLARHARPNSSDHGWLRLPRPLFGLYYLVRPLRLMSERWREAIRPALRNLAGILPRGLSIRA